MQDAYPGVFDGHESHTRKKAAVHYTLHTPYLAKIWKILCLDPSLLCASFIAAVPSAIITRRCVLRSTLAKPWVPPVWP